MGVITSGKETDCSKILKDTTGRPEFKKMAGIAAKVIGTNNYVEFMRTSSTTKESGTPKTFHEYTIRFTYGTQPRPAEISQLIKDTNKTYLHLNAVNVSPVETLVMMKNCVPKEKFETLTLGTQIELDARVGLKFRDIICNMGVTPRLLFVFPHNDINEGDPYDDIFVPRTIPQLAQLLKTKCG